MTSVTSVKTPARKAARQVSPEEYGEFIQGVELRDVLLVESGAKRLEFPQPNAVLGLDIKSKRPHFQIHPDGFTATAKFEIDLTYESDDGDQKIFATFRIVFETIYLSKIDISTGIFDIFQQVNLPLNVWPYVRQYVHHQSLLMGIPPLVLPVYRTQQ